MGEQSKAIIDADSQVYMRKRNGTIKRWSKLLLRSKTGTVGLLIVFFITLVAVFAPILAPHDPNAINPGGLHVPPSWMEGEAQNIYLEQII